MRKGKRCGGGAEAHVRLCLKCGVDGALYGPGTHLTICSRSYVLCNICKDLTDRVGDYGLCAACSPQRCSMHLTHTDGYHIDDDDGWPYEMGGPLDRNRSRDPFIWSEG
jgi:hypothetical protein